MASVNKKDIPNKINILGQYFTPESLADFCINKVKFGDLTIEPSCGKGVFLDRIVGESIGIEIDREINDKVLNINFYDFELTKNYKSITFVGNPPFHCPAVSLTKHPIYSRHSYLRNLAKKYGVVGTREEAIFFIIKSVDLILKYAEKGDIYYILPKNVFHNNSRAYKTFFSFLNKYANLVELWDLGKEFEGVNTDLCFAHFSVGRVLEQFHLNDEVSSVDEFYGVNEDMIPFQRIFKKTYLGSVPCESIFLSVRNEPINHFRDRLVRLFESEVNEENLVELLSYEGEPHLVSLKKRDKEKIKVVCGYVREARNLVKDFGDYNFYKVIQHRNEKRWYFRHDALKRAKFLYQLNPNPCRSFYFPGNVVKNCLDYHGYTEFDVNRNCSPSANRAVPLDGDYLTDYFKQYMDDNGLLHGMVFEYLSFILRSDWYKKMKTLYQRWYFSVPVEFDKRFLKEINEA